MKEYETVAIFKPDLSAERHAKVADRLKKSVADNKGELLLEKDWGQKKMSYLLGKYQYGRYFYFNYASENGNIIAEIEKALKYDENVLRFMTVKVAKDALKNKAKKVTEMEEPVTNFEENIGFKRRSFDDSDDSGYYDGGRS